MLTAEMDLRAEILIYNLLLKPESQDLFPKKVQYGLPQLGDIVNELAFQDRIKVGMIDTMTELSVQWPSRLERIRHASAHHKASGYLTALRHQNVIGTAGGTRVHDIDP
ncbi:hypothetical protein [Candidatus Thiosymbion oneisti]|uniref:hypothetical protein n=1 Tax=Candidatus Thiosymbion oneisti TaxID=589554 RepID=UPI00159F2628|nr:hypothetical protein [Candidatus Thiosymbion oneisti]